ncbi:MAG: hypothetical protein VYE77_10910 [Planctomycetota bacterium]|nr:hypothetical protein [Planctomycetota bacterium]
MHNSNLRLSVAILTFALMGAPAFGQEPIPLSDIEAAQIVWTETDKPPEWRHTSKREPGMFSFATAGFGSAHQLAILRAKEYCRRHARATLTEHLLPVLGEEDATPTVDTMLRHTQLAEAVYEATRPAPNDAPFTVASAYLRWQVPIREVIQQLEPRLQGRVEWLLLRDPVSWRGVKQAPEWAGQVPARKGQYRFVLTHEGHMPKDTHQKALQNARAEAEALLVHALAEAVEETSARQAVLAGCTRLAPVRKASWRRRVAVPDQPGNTQVVTTSYVLWEIPVSTLTGALPAEVRQRALSALDKAMQADAK